MKSGVVALAALGFLGLSGAALAQTAPPPARTGFQMDIRTGYSVPMGSAFNGTKLSDTTSGEVPFLVDIGAKVIPQLFIGGYTGFAIGGAGGASKASCEARNADCLTLRFHLGVEAQYHILPAGRVNPWLGYGLGIESFGQSRTVNGLSTTLTMSGFEFARFMAGVDFRVHRVFGVGPFVDLSMASFNRMSDGSNSATITDSATHSWLTFGARFVFFP